MQRKTCWKIENLQQKKIASLKVALKKFRIENIHRRNIASLKLAEKKLQVWTELIFINVYVWYYLLFDISLQYWLKMVKYSDACSILRTTQIVTRYWRKWINCFLQPPIFSINAGLFMMFDTNDCSLTISFSWSNCLLLWSTL